MASLRKLGVLCGNVLLSGSAPLTNPARAGGFILRGEQGFVARRPARPGALWAIQPPAHLTHKPLMGQGLCVDLSGHPPIRKGDGTLLNLLAFDRGASRVPRVIR